MTIMWHTVYPKKYAHGFCFAVLCCGYTLTDFPISTRLTSLALWESNDCPSASKATLMNMDKYFMWIHYERLHYHNKAKHNKTVCIFLGIYCTNQKLTSGDTLQGLILCHGFRITTKYCKCHDNKTFVHGAKFCCVDCIELWACNKEMPWLRITVEKQFIKWTSALLHCHCDKHTAVRPSTDEANLKKTRECITYIHKKWQ